MCRRLHSLRSRTRALVGLTATIRLFGRPGSLFRPTVFISLYLTTCSEKLRRSHSLPFPPSNTCCCCCVGAKTQIPPRPAPVLAKADRDSARCKPSSPLLLAGSVLDPCRDAPAILSGHISGLPALSSHKILLVSREWGEEFELYTIRSLLSYDMHVWVHIYTGTLF